MVIIHGENQSQARPKLQTLIDQSREAGSNVVRLEAKKLTVPVLQETLGGGDLFGTQQLIVIEELHSLPTSNQKKSLIETLAATTDSTNLILWEKKTLTATQLKKFPKALVFEFKIANQMWEFLDNLGSTNKTQLLKQLQGVIAANDEFFVFTMICRQIRLLISTKDGGAADAKGFAAAKLQKQATRFSLPQLLELHRQLFKLEVQQKTSTLGLSLAGELDRLLLRM